MNIVKPMKPDGEAQALASIDGEIRDFVRRDPAVGRKSQIDGGELGSDKLSTLIDRVSANSVKEIDRLIAELKAVRDFLHAEGERVQREITSYANVSQTAMASVKIIMEGMGQWKDTHVSSPSIMADRPLAPK